MLFEYGGREIPSTYLTTLPGQRLDDLSALSSAFRPVNSELANVPRAFHDGQRSWNVNNMSETHANLDAHFARQTEPASNTLGPEYNTFEPEPSFAESGWGQESNVWGSGDNEYRPWSEELVRSYNDYNFRSGNTPESDSIILQRAQRAATNAKIASYGGTAASVLTSTLVSQPVQGAVTQATGGNDYVGATVGGAVGGSAGTVAEAGANGGLTYVLTGNSGAASNAATSIMKGMPLGIAKGGASALAGVAVDKAADAILPVDHSKGEFTVVYNKILRPQLKGLASGTASGAVYGPVGAAVGGALGMSVGFGQGLIDFINNPYREDQLEQQAHMREVQAYQASKQNEIEEYNASVRAQPTNTVFHGSGYNPTAHARAHADQPTPAADSVKDVHVQEDIERGTTAADAVQDISDDAMKKVDYSNMSRAEIAAYQWEMMARQDAEREQHIGNDSGSGETTSKPSGSSNAPHPIVGMLSVAATGAISGDPDDPNDANYDPFRVRDRDRYQADLGLDKDVEEAAEIDRFAREERLAFRANRRDRRRNRRDTRARDQGYANYREMKREKRQQRRQREGIDFNQNSNTHPAMAGDGYTIVDTYPGGGDVPDWARGNWYKGFAHREIPDTGVFTPGKLLPRSGSSQANEALIGLGIAGLAATALSRILVRA